MNFFSFHIGDYVSATRHLSWDEDCAFRRLLDVYYLTEKPIPLDSRQVFRLTLAQTDDQRESIETVLKEFFERTEFGWVNHRADSELANMRDRQEKQRDKANKRWNKPKPSPGIAPAMPVHIENDAVALKIDAGAMPPVPVPVPVPIKPPKPPSAAFDAFWVAYPKKANKAAALKSWQKLNPDEPLAQRILEAVEAARKSGDWRKDEGRFIPHPATWLNGQRWNDEPSSSHDPCTDPHWWAQAGYGSESGALAAGEVPA